MKYLTILLVLLFSSAYSANAQEAKRAGKLYDDFGYKSTTSLYEKMIQKDKVTLTLENMRQIADSYRLFHDTQNAEKWYAQIIESTDDPKDYLHYAQSLQSNGNTVLAKEYFLKYNQAFGDTDNRGSVLANSIDRMNEFERSGVTVKNERILNSRKIEFSPQFYEKGIVFVSTKPSGLKSKKDIWLDDNFMSLFYSEMNNDGSLKDPQSFSSKLNSKFHEGPVSFSKSGDQIFFTKSNYSKGKRKLSEDGVLKLQIFTATKKEDKWVKPTPLPFNNEESDEVHPSLSADGQKLFFASNREGGFGGTDLYMSQFKEGKWNAPTNLGPTINTSGNELFPFIHDDGTLYFSSNGHPGLGGLDIYSTVYFEDNWNTPANMGTPINSEMDDLGFIINVLNSEGYFSSDRKSGIGKDDIYSFQVEPDELQKPIIQRLNAEICTLNKNTNSKIPFVTLRVSENIHFGDKDDQIYTTDKFGDVNITLNPDKVYAFRAEKNGYSIGEKTFSTEGISSSENLSFCIGMTAELDNCARIAGIVTNAKDGSRIPNTIIALTSNCNGQLLSISSNLLGEFESSCLPCNCVYKIQGIKTGYVMLNEEINLASIDCSQNQTVYYNLQLYSENEDPSIAGKSSLSSPRNPSSLALGVGTSINLDDIYYDFNESKIRRDAAESLNELAGVLRAYPSMEISLTAHTDSRGTNAYNDVLSAERAQSARSFLLSEGISANRISISSRGENLLRNHCADGVKCNEQQHQYNRRTEVMVTKLENENIPVNYSKNTPVTYLQPVTKQQYENPSQASVSQTSSISANMEYRIQFFSSISSFRDFRHLDRFGQIIQEAVEGGTLTRYFIGNLTYQRAKEILPLLQSQGFERSFIVSYNNGVRGEEMD